MRTEEYPNLAFDHFIHALREGLSKDHPAIPCKFLYDDAGSVLFEEITNLPEYYPTRTERKLLREVCPDVADIIGPNAVVLEFGAGSMRKTRALLSALSRPKAYLPIDVSGEYLLSQTAGLSGQFPGLHIQPIVADFTEPLNLPPDLDANAPLLGFFPGSTIGNLSPAQGRDFLKNTSRMMGPNALMLVGVDLAKDPSILQAAYDDAQGVTAKFTRNLLVRANREAGTDFQVDHFDHHVWWNARESRIEISLMASKPMDVMLGVERFSFRRGDKIHVENCYKYSTEQISWLARMGGWTLEQSWEDEYGLYAMHLLRAKPLRGALKTLS